MEEVGPGQYRATGRRLLTEARPGLWCAGRHRQVSVGRSAAASKYRPGGVWTVRRDVDAARGRPLAFARARRSAASPASPPMADESDAAAGAAAQAAPPTLDDLVGYFRSGGQAARRRAASASSRRRSRRSPTGGRVPYEGADGIEALLGGLEGARLLAHGARTGTSSRSRAAATASPSSRAGSSSCRARRCATAAACAAVLRAHVAEVARSARALGIRFLGIGARPFGALDDMLVAAQAALRRHAQPTSRSRAGGRLAHHMMKRTATVQANFDFADEADAVDEDAHGVRRDVARDRALRGLARHRGPAQRLQERARRDLARDRRGSRGLLPFAFEPGFAFRDYAEWALDVPMFFVVRGGVYRPARRADLPPLPARGLRGRDGDAWRTGSCTCRRSSPRCGSSATSRCAAPTRARCRWRRRSAALWRGLLDDAAARRGGLGASSRAPRWPSARRCGARCRARASRRASAGTRRATWPSSSSASRAPGSRACPAAPPTPSCSSRSLAYAAAGRSPADDLLDDFDAAGGDPATLVAKLGARP